MRSLVATVLAIVSLQPAARCHVDFSQLIG
jgi:hypothetical protein